MEYPIPRQEENQGGLLGRGQAPPGITGVQIRVLYRRFRLKGGTVKAISWNISLAPEFLLRIQAF